MEEIVKKYVNRKTIEEKFEEHLQRYKKDYDLSTLNNSNDVAMLKILIQYEIIVEELQRMLDKIINERDLVQSAGEIKKISDLIRDMMLIVTNAQKTLAIDRASRKSQEEVSPIQYIHQLKKAATEFFERKLIYVRCESCKVAVGRIIPIHDHTAYYVEFECSQCGKMVSARRKSKDRMFDIPQHDRVWRTARVEIIQAEQSEIPVFEEIADAYNIEGEPDAKIDLTS